MGVRHGVCLNKTQRGSSFLVHGGRTGRPSYIFTHTYMEDVDRLCWTDIKRITVCVAPATSSLLDPLIHLIKLRAVRPQPLKTGRTAGTWLKHCEALTRRRRRWRTGPEPGCARSVAGLSSPSIGCSRRGDWSPRSSASFSTSCAVACPALGPGVAGGSSCTCHHFRKHHGRRSGRAQCKSLDAPHFPSFRWEVLPELCCTPHMRVKPLSWTKPQHAWIAYTCGAGIEHSLLDDFFRVAPTSTKNSEKHKWSLWESWGNRFLVLDLQILRTADCSLQKPKLRCSQMCLTSSLSDTTY